MFYLFDRKRAYSTNPMEGPWLGCIPAAGRALVWGRLHHMRMQGAHLVGFVSLSNVQRFMSEHHLTGLEIYGEEGLFGEFARNPDMGPSLYMETLLS